MVANAPQGFKVRQDVPAWKALLSVAAIALITVPAFFYVKAHPIPDGLMGILAPSFILLLFISIIPLAIYVDRAQTRFWKEVALSYGFAYEKAPKFESPGAVMFRQGHSRRCRHVLTGEFEGIPLRMYQYQFTEGHGKHSTTRSYSVFEFSFKGRFPHFYLNYRNNFNPPFFASGREVRLPAGVEARFALRVPDQYEIEALEIFTPDTVAFLLDSDWKYDVEMLDSTMIVFGRTIPASVEVLQKELEKMAALLGHFTRKLDRASFEPIGNNRYRL